MSLRNVATLLVAALVITYLAIFALLFVYQRSFLFFGGRHEVAMNPAYHAVRIREAGGVTLRLWETAVGKPHAPVVVFFYGNAGTLSDFQGIGEALHDEGYTIVLASYRGYSGNPGLPSEDGLMDDARSILKSLPTDHGPIILWGQSLGSGVAARMASEGRADALILQSPYTAVVDVAARRFPIYPVRWVMRDRFNTLALVPKIKMPVLIMHGTKDDVVPFDMGVTLSHRFGAEATFVAIPNRGHNDLGIGDLLPIADKWLKGHIAWPRN
ncbi:MAG TPA: alpha/beta hydrolase [Rhizomicrobium sp.]|nr:alpha/beta hydrolase [Rhizomicrobium sp.]